MTAEQPVTPEQFLKEGLKLKGGRPYSPTETQLRFIRNLRRKASGSSVKTPRR